MPTKKVVFLSDTAVFGGQRISSIMVRNLEGNEVFKEPHLALVSVNLGHQCQKDKCHRRRDDLSSGGLYTLICDGCPKREDTSIVTVKSNRT